MSEEIREQEPEEISAILPESMQEDPPVAAVEPEPEPPPKKRRGRPKKQKEPEYSDPVENSPVEMSEEDAHQLDFDSWAQKWDWNRPGMQMKVTRTSPNHFQGMPLGGLMEPARQNMPYLESEIAEKWGGDTYRVFVSGPRMTRTGEKIMCLSSKVLQCPGYPRTDYDALPMETKDSIHSEKNYRKVQGVRGQPGYAQGSSHEEWLQDRLDRVEDRGKESVEHVSLLKEGFEKAAELQTNAVNRVSEERGQIMQQRIDAAKLDVERARADADRFRDEKEKALEEVRQMQQKVFDEREKMRSEQENKVEVAASKGNEMLGTLLPMMQQNSHQQLSDMRSTFENRLDSVTKDAESRIRVLEQSYENRLQAERDYSRLQQEGNKQIFQGRIQQLEHDLQHARQENTWLREKLEEANNRVLQEIQRMNQSNDPAEQLGKLGGVLGTVMDIKESFGGGESGGGDIGDGIDNPWAKSVMGLISKGFDNIPHITEALASRQNQMMQQQQMQQMPPGHVPQQLPPGHPQQQVRRAPQPQPQPQPQQQQVPQEAPQPAPPQKSPTAVSLSKQDLEAIVTYINAVLESTPSLTSENEEEFKQVAEQFAMGVTGKADNKLLSELARRDPVKVVEQFEEKGILSGRALTDDGKLFCIEVLKAIRQLQG